MRLEFFAAALAEICSRSQLAPDRALRWVVIANPAAGGFTIPSRWKKCRKVLEECRETARSNPVRKNCFPVNIKSNGLVLTTGPGSAAEITRSVIKEAAAAPDNSDTAPFYLVITAGGDGTSLEVLSTLYRASGEVRANMAILRLPVGTGNDGADSPDLAAALKLLIRPSRIEFAPALRLLTSPSGAAALKAPFLAFNILSVGVDAFVTHMTNKMKGKFPGDFYKLWVDIAALFYDRLYTIGFLDIKIISSGESLFFREKLLLLAVGASGHRTYGSQKKILPDERNVCALKQMPLLRKLVLKGLLSTGAHIDKPETMLFNACRVEISGSFPILAQMDGETVLLQREDFPVVIELTSPVIPVLKSV